MALYVDVHTFGDSLRYRRSEWAMAVFMAFGWGGTLLLPHDTFSASPSYLFMRQWADEEIWGIGCLALGVARLAVLYVNGRWWRCSHARMVVAGLSALVWLIITVGLLRAGVVGPGLVIWPTCLVMELHTVYEAGGDARAADDRRARRT